MNTSDLVVGTWSLVSFVARRTDGGETREPWGQTPAGRLIYTADGHVAAVLAKPDRAPFVSEDPTGGTLDEINEAFEGLEAYAGRYEFDEVADSGRRGRVDPGLAQGRVAMPDCGQDQTSNPGQNLACNRSSISRRTWSSGTPAIWTATERAGLSGPATGPRNLRPTSDMCRPRSSLPGCASSGSLIRRGSRTANPSH
jgi:hypothetical protein